MKVTMRRLQVYTFWCALKMLPSIAWVGIRSMWYQFWTVRHRFYTETLREWQRNPQMKW